MSGNEAVTAPGSILTQITVLVPVLALALLICSSLVEPGTQIRTSHELFSGVRPPCCLQLMFGMAQWFYGPKVLTGPAMIPNCQSTEFI